MKRTFTFLMTALFLCVGMVKAAVTDVPEMSAEGDIKWYTISNTRSTSGKYLYWTADGVKDANTLTGASLFYFTAGVGDTCYIHNAATELLFSGVGAWTEAGVGCVISETPHSSKAGVAIEFSGTALNEQNQADGFTTWSANDAGSIFVISPATVSIEEAIAKLDANKAANNTLMGEYKYEEEAYNNLVAALAVLNTATGSEAVAAFENCVAIMANLTYVMPEEGKLYVIECPIFKAAKGVSKGLNSAPGWNTINLKDSDYYWTVEVKDGAYALKNLKTGTYLNGTSMSASAAYAQLNRLGEQQFNIVVNGTTVHANGHSAGAGASGNIVSWAGSANSASAWVFVERADPASLVDVAVTYSFTYGDEVKYTQTTSTFVGEEWPAITVALPYGVSAVKPEGTIAAEDHTDGAVTKVIELAVAELPFVAAEDVNSISEWYYATMHSNYPKYIEENKDGGIDWVKESYEGENTDSLLWGFAGNVFDGIKVVNKGTGHAIVSTSGAAVMGDAANATAFVLSATTTGVKNGFCLKYPESNYLNASAGKVGSWGAADAGSTFQLVSLSSLYNLDEVIEGDWADVTNAAPGEWAIIDHAELLGLGEYWVATNNTRYDEERGVMEFVAGENTSASLIQEYCPFGKATYRLTGKAFHKGATNAVLFVGDQTVEIPAAAEGATFENAEEHFTTFSIEFTCEAAWGTQLTVGYSCEFDNAEDFLVVGGLKLEEKKSTTLRSIFMETIMSCESLGWEIMQMTALYAQQQAVMVEAMPIYEALMGEQQVLKADVEKSIADMEAVMDAINSVAEYYKGDFMDALWAVEELKWKFDEESEEYVALDAAIAAASDVAEVTTVAELEAKVVALEAAVAPLYNLDEAIEGDWVDVTNAAPGEWAIIDHAELLGLGEYWMVANNTRYDEERGVMEFVAGENTSASLIQEYCPFGQATYRLTGKAFHNGAVNAVMFVGDQTVEIPAAAEGATFENAEEHFTTFSIEFTCEAAWGTQLTVGYSCEFDNAEDFLVVGGLKLEEKKNTTLRSIFMETIMSCESLGWEIMQMTALYAQQQAVMEEAMPIYEAIMGNQQVLKADVEQSIAAMEAVIAELSPVAQYYKGDFMDALWAAEEMLWELDEESEAYADLEAAIAEASDVAEVTTVAELEAKVAALAELMKLIEAGVDHLETEGEVVIYDLQGNRVTEMTKGLYIVNGKKVLVK